MVFELFNPRLATQALGMFGMRNYLFYMPLPFIVPFLFEGRADLYKFLKFNFVITAFVCVLGAVQYSLPSDHVLNKYGNTMHKMDIAKFDGRDTARITGTFSYLTGYTSYLTFIGILLYPFVFTSGGRERYLYMGLLVAVYGNVMMSGGRGPILLLLMAIPPFLYLAMFGLNNDREAKIIRFRLYTRLAIGGAVAMVAAVTILKDPVNALIKRFNTYDDENSRIEAIYSQPFDAIGEAGFMGWGPAMTHQARWTIMRMTKTHAVMPEPGEEEPYRIMKEIGLLGFIIWYTLRFMFLIWSFQLIFEERDGFFRLMLISFWLLQLTSLPTPDSDQPHPIIFILVYFVVFAGTCHSAYEGQTETQIPAIVNFLRVGRDTERV